MMDIFNIILSALSTGLDGLYPDIPVYTEWVPDKLPAWQYGSELSALVGKDADYVNSEAKRMITDALSTDTRITGVRDFSIENGVIHFTIDTIFGSRAAQTEVTS